MTGLRLAPAARRDMAAIWAYTAKAWGADQAESYIRTLHRDMDRLREYPELGATHPTRLADLRKLASGHHLVFYCVTGDGVEVVRVLHERMDAARHLPK